MGSRKQKDALYEQLARFGKALSAPRRVELLELLAQAPRTVESLATETAMSIANTSQHLQVLRAAGLVLSEKSGLFVTYRLASPAVEGLLLEVRTLAEERLDELVALRARFFADGSDLEPVRGGELLTLAQRGMVVLLDVRPVEEFAAGHFPHAVSIPHDELLRRLAELPKDKKIVAYCRGPYCVFASEAVKRLRARGFQASRTEDGVGELRALGLPIEHDQFEAP